MSDPVIRLDRSKPFSECRGERTPDDPHYKVHFWQGTKVGDKTVLLPFNSHDELVPDDGKTEPSHGVADNKPVVFHPLYDKAMRDLVERKKKRLSDAAKGRAVAPEQNAADDDDEADSKIDTADDVNFVSWLRGEARYTPQELRAAAKKRFSKNYPQIKELVVDLVLDEKLLPEAQVCAALAMHLPKAA